MSENVIKKCSYKIINSLINPYGKWKSKSYDTTNKIVTFCTGRSGSTWLAEIMVSIPGYHMIYEPFNPRENPKCEESGLWWNNYVRLGEEGGEREDYVEKVLDGRELSTRILNRYHFDPTELIGKGGYVVKCIHANMMSSWMCDRFPISGILLLRHPCAVVASQLRNDGWRWAVDKELIGIPEEVFEDYPHFVDVFDSLSTPVENLAFVWAMQNYVPLQQGGEWMLTTYERLVERREKELERLFSHVGRPVPEEAEARLYRESRSGSSHENKDDLLSDWRKRLDASQIDQILSVAHRVGVTCYTRDLHPDYGALPIEAE